jgi:hypothetical protein
VLLAAVLTVYTYSRAHGAGVENCLELLVVVVVVVIKL